MQKPIVAAVEGYCYAGGMEILQAFDIRVAAENAQLAVSEVQRGLFPMSRLDDPAAAPDPVHGGDGHAPRRRPRSRAQRAYEIGLVGHVTPTGGALAKARELADRWPPTGRWRCATSRRR